MGPLEGVKVIELQGIGPGQVVTALERLGVLERSPLRLVGGL